MPKKSKRAQPIGITPGRQAYENIRDFMDERVKLLSPQEYRICLQELHTEIIGRLDGCEEEDSQKYTGPTCE